MLNIILQDNDLFNLLESVRFVITLLPKLNEIDILSPFKYISEAHPGKYKTFKLIIITD